MSKPMRTIEELIRNVPQEEDYTVEVTYMHTHHKMVTEFNTLLINKYPFIKGMKFGFIENHRFNMKCVLYVSTEEEKSKLRSKEVREEYTNFMWWYCSKRKNKRWF